MKPLTIFILSDSSGETAESVAKACIVQFPPDCAMIHRLPKVRNADQLTALIKQTTLQQGIIAYTLVLPEYRKILEKEAQRLHLQTVDLLGPLLERLSETTHQTPLSEPGRLHLLDERYFERIAAIDFSIRFDDGKNPEHLKEAEVILIGVSRTSKTPNCMYLAQHYGLKSANIPIVLDFPPPHRLFEIDKQRIIGLTIEPNLLKGIRTNRAQFLGVESHSDYSNPSKIQAEIEYAKNIFRQLRCKVLDVSNKAVEEVSSEIIRHIRNYYTKN